MKKPQYITIAAGLVLVAILLAFAPRFHKQINVEQKVVNEQVDPVIDSDISVDSLLTNARQSLSSQENLRLQQLEKSLQKEAGDGGKITIYHQLAHFWKDTAQSFIPYAWYTAESARLENSEKNLNFAAHLFLDRVQQEEDPELRKWLAIQAKDLFERSLIVNPNNDSTKVGLGATYLFGGISQFPMEGITKIREVVDKDSTNMYAQTTLALASVMSRQYDKAKQRLEAIVRLQPKNVQALLMLGDVCERMNDKPSAINWYAKAISLIPRNDIKTELQKRISDLKKEL